MSEVISLFRSLRAGSQVFALLMLFLLSDFAYYVFGQELAVAVHLALWYEREISLTFTTGLVSLC